MRTILLFLIVLPALSHSQLAKTTIKDIGKVGAIKLQKAISITGNDTTIMYSMSKNAGMFDISTGYIVVLYPREIPEVIEALKSFQSEIKKPKPDNMTIFSYKTKDSTILSCNYIKLTGWDIMIQNTYKQVEEANDIIQNKTGYIFNQFVQIDPFKLEAVIKLLNKVINGEKS